MCQEFKKGSAGWLTSAPHDISWGVSMPRRITCKRITHMAGTWCSLSVGISARNIIWYCQPRALISRALILLSVDLCWSLHLTRGILISCKCSDALSQTFQNNLSITLLLPSHYCHHNLTGRGDYLLMERVVKSRSHLWNLSSDSAFTQSSKIAFAIY